MVDITDKDVTIHIRLCIECDYYKFIDNFHWHTIGKLRHRKCRMCRTDLNLRRRRINEIKKLNNFISMKW